MLLVDDDEPEVLELDARLQQPVRADDDVHLAGRQPVERHLRLRARAEARQQLDLHGPVGEAVGERLVVLLCQQRRRHEHRDLLAALHGDERRAQRDLGLAEADVAADHAVHRLARAQVLDHGLDGVQLVDGLLEREAGLERTHLLVVHLEGVAFACSAAGVDVEQLRRRVTNLRRGARARLRPLVAAELVQRRGLRGRAGIAADAFERLDRHVQLVALGVFEHEEFGGHAAGVHRRQAGVASDAVIFVHDRRARTQVRELLDDLRGIAVGASPPSFLARALAEQLFLGVDRDGGSRSVTPEASGATVSAMRASESRNSCQLPTTLAVMSYGPQQFEQQFAPAGRFGGQQHAALGVAQLVRERVQRLFAALVDAGGRRGFGPEVHDRHGRDGLQRNRFGHVGARGSRRRRPEQDVRQRGRRGEPLVRRHADLGRVEHRMLDVVPALLEALDQRTPGIAQSRIVLGRQDHRGARWQVIEQRGGLLEEQRQVVLDAGRGETLADVAIERHARQVALEARAEAPPEVLDRLGRQAELAGRQQVEPRQLFERALRFGVEAADAVDDVVEQVDPQRRFAAHRKHVEQRATDGEVAGFAHLRHARVAGAGEAQAELLEVQRLAGLEAERVAVDERARRQALQHGLQVDDHDAALAGRAGAPACAGAAK